MKPSILVLLLTATLTAQALAVVITFDSPATFDAQFPLANRSSVGGASTVSLLSSPSRVDLHAQQASGDVAAPARMSIFSTTSSAYDFISSQKTFTFANVGFSYASTGATYTAILGVFSTPSSGGALGTDDGIFFLIDRGGGRLRLMERYNGTQFLLQEWTGLGSSPSAYSFTSMELTLSASSWSLSATSAASTTYNGSGVFTNGTSAHTYNGTNWGSDFYLGLESEMTLPTLDTARFLDLTVESIAVVPEPGTGSLLTLGFLPLAWMLRRRGAALLRTHS